MTQKADRQISAMEAQIALPRENGELIFQAPWEARAFGLAVALNQQDLYEWREFSAELAATIAAADQNNDPANYYIPLGSLLSREQLDEELIIKYFIAFFIFNVGVVDLSRKGLHGPLVN